MFPTSISGHYTKTKIPEIFPVEKGKGNNLVFLKRKTLHEKFKKKIHL